MPSTSRASTTHPAMLLLAGLAIVLMLPAGLVATLYWKIAEKRAQRPPGELRR